LLKCPHLQANYLVASLELTEEASTTCSGSLFVKLITIAIAGAIGVFVAVMGSN